MTRSDKWKKRECVERYWAFKDDCSNFGMTIPQEGAHIIFCVQMPKSWSVKKKKSMFDTPHQQKPDIDNFLKAIFDAVFDDDCHIWDMHQSKVWNYDGMILIGEKK